jgi:hypothetical protein
MTQEVHFSFFTYNLMSSAINKIAPIITKKLFIGTINDPKLRYLFAVINKSTNKEYPVNAL